MVVVLVYQLHTLCCVCRLRGAVGEHARGSDHARAIGRGAVGPAGLGALLVGRAGSIFVVDGAPLP